MPMRAILEVVNLQKSFILHEFDHKTIVGCSGVGFRVHPGEFVGVMGTSGSGKSTMLKCIYRTYLPTDGQMRFDSEELGNIDLATASEREVIFLRRREIGYVSQFLSVLPRVTALDIVAGSLIALGAETEEAQERARELLVRFQLRKSLWETYPHTFSGGEKLRLNLAKEIVKRPRLLLLDEPTAALDTHSKELVLDMLVELKSAGTCMIGIFHDLDFMEKIVDTKYTMRAGVLNGDVV